LSSIPPSRGKSSRDPATFTSRVEANCRSRGKNLWPVLTWRVELSSGAGYPPERLSLSEMPESSRCFIATYVGEGLDVAFPDALA